MSAPPKAAVTLLRLLSGRKRRAEAEGDLLEVYEEWQKSGGASAARWRLWREVMMIAVWRIIGSWRRSRDVSVPVDVPPGGNGRPPGGGRAGWRPLLESRQDLDYALRRMVRTPGATVVAIAILAIGVGGNATIFTMAETLFVSPPPLISHPQELVGLEGGVDGRVVPEFGYYDFEFFRSNSSAFRDVLAYGGFPGTRGRTPRSGGEVSVGTGEARVQAQAWVVSANYFRVLGVPLALGAGFTGDVGQAAVAPELVLSNGFWQRNFGEDPAVLERPLSLNGIRFRVVGVTPREFRGINPADRPPDLYIPIRAAGTISAGFDEALRRFGDAGEPRASRFLRLVARLRPGIDMAAAQAEMQVMQNTWDAEFGSWSKVVYGGDYRFRLRSEFHLTAFEARQLQRTVTLLWFVVGSVFLIACTNLALLLIARSAGREREMGIRAALGAGRARLLRQVLTESLVLAGLGGALGVGIAFLATDTAALILPLPVAATFRPSATVVVFALVLSGVAAVLFGTMPAWMLSRLNVLEALQRPGQGRVRVLFRGGLVAGQTALSIVLLVAGGLFARSLQQARDVDLGFERENRLLMSVQLENHGITEAQGFELITGVLDRLAGVPGVVAVSTANRIPFVGSTTWNFTVPGTGYAEEGLRSGLNLVGPGYFEVMEIPLVTGRGFSRNDEHSSPKVAVVNEVFGDRMWPGESPVGKVIPLFDEEYTVVGVARNAVYYDLREAPWPHVYLSQLQLYVGRMTFLVATRTDPMAAAGAVDAALREINPNIAVAFTTLDQLVEEQLSSFRIWTVIVSIFSGVALLLAMVGLYGVQSFLVARRTREIGIRMALGARVSSVVAGVVRGSLLIGGLGTLLGVAAAFAAAGLVRGFLFGVPPHDPAVFIVVPLLLLLACALASVIPAARASKVNPVEALSQE